MVLTKEKGGLKFLIIIFAVLPIFAHGYCAWKGGFTAAALQVHLYILPLSVLSFLFAFSIHRSLKNRLVVTDSGLLAEDFSKVEFPWKSIRRVSTKSQILPRGGACLWLVLHTCRDSDYASSKVRKLNRLIGVDGVPVCNLSTYAGDIERFLALVEQRAAHA
ncbi:MAG: hypothetical protein VX393_12110 [Pseudomonadota bacterium]|nr:hypothetical protein [Pseudomonadota bacterium]